MNYTFSNVLLVFMTWQNFTNTKFVIYFRDDGKVLPRQMKHEYQGGDYDKEPPEEEGKYIYRFNNGAITSFSGLLFLNISYMKLYYIVIIIGIESNCFAYKQNYWWTGLTPFQLHILIQTHSIRLQYYVFHSN